jgi:ATP-binding cassette subfamily B protein
MDEYRSATFSIKVFKDLLENTQKLSLLAWKERKFQIITLFVVFIVVSSMPFVQSWTRGELINQLIALTGTSAGEKTLSPFFILVGIIIAAGTLSTIAWTIQGYISKSIYFFLDEKLETGLLLKRAEIDVISHEDPSYSNLLQKINEDGLWRAKNFLERQFFLFQNILEVTIASVILLTASWWVFLIVFLGTIPELFVETKYGRDVWHIHGSRAEVRRRYWNTHGYFTNLSNLLEIRLFQNTKYFLSVIQKMLLAFHKQELKNERKKLFYQLISLIASQGVLAFATVWFVVQVFNGNLLIGTLTFILASIADFRQALSSFLRNIGRQYQDSLFVKDMFTVLDTQPVLVYKEKPTVLSPQKTPTITFEHVSFTYPESVSPTLKNIHFTINPGEKIALVGINGAGKTTLIKLLCRFYDPTEGKILIDGIDLKEIDLESWYRIMGILFQDYTNFRIPVHEAIAVGNTALEENFEKIQSSAHESEASIFISKWAKQYQQMLGKEFTDGVEPSVGQWQKLAIARTLYRNPHIYVLDEPTASIDAEAEAKIFERLEKLPDDRTVILISHRFSTVRHANQIIVLEEGTISEQGTHAELLKNNKTYARLFKLQARGYQ